jgi:hypothetical protein
VGPAGLQTCHEAQTLIRPTWVFVHESASAM